ncbi:MAG: insulinase family protein, partial [Spirochaetes bacterium]|nr:insulinase family protein [Spirochaetota bacterium]
MKLYYMFLIICLSFLSITCKTTYHPSIFRGVLDKKVVISVEKNRQELFLKKIVLKNDFKILLKQSNNNRICYSIYLKNPCLFQTPLTSGVEKILLLYIKNRILNKTKQKFKTNDFLNIEVYANKDFSSLSFNINKKYSKKILQIIIDSIKITRFNYNELKLIIKDNYTNFINQLNNPAFYLNYKIYNKIFKSSVLFNSFEGNLISLNSLSPEDIIKHYKNHFTTDRLLFVITGNIEKNDFEKNNFINLEQFFYKNNDYEKEYSTLISNKFQNPPKYYSLKKIKESCYLSALYKAPSFLDDDYLAYYIAMLILKDNFTQNSFEYTEPAFLSKMINTINYGEISFYSKNDSIELNLLSFKKVIEKLEEGTGLFYYTGDNTNDIVKDYRLFDENKIIIKSLSLILPKYKKKILEEYNFSDM